MYIYVYIIPDSVQKKPSPATFAPYKCLGLFFTLGFNVMGFSPKIDMMCFKNLGRFWALLASCGTDMSQWGVFSHCLIFVLRKDTFLKDPTALFFKDPTTS